MKKVWLCYSNAQSWNSSLWLPRRYGKQGKNFFPAPIRFAAGSESVDSELANYKTRMQGEQNVIHMGLQRTYETKI